MVHILDTRQLGRSGIIAATALETSEGLVFFDVGAESTFQNLVAELRHLGFSPNDVRHVFLSHIHLDHAGAAWRFAKLGATVYVHPRGAAHLLDPAKLIQSATRIFGADMEKLWGHIAPVPKERLRIIEDNEVVRIGSIRVRALATPGHASHHHVYHWDDTLFGGDVAGVRMDGGPSVPPFVPPELNVESWLASIERMRALEVAKLYLPHFGMTDGSVTAHFDSLAERVGRWSEWFRDRLRGGLSENELIPLFAAYEANDLHSSGAAGTQLENYELADPSYMAVPAASRYWHKYHPEAIGAEGASRES
jgi:glyoxylase-like metal-dependent hydrolase (beta-lactamase superfamily II)